jgi:hypothetical protein
VSGDGWSLVWMFGAAALFGLPRGRVTHRFETFIAAPPKTIWDTYFAHVNKADYRPGTRLLDAHIVRQAPLTVAITVQQGWFSGPRRVVFVYDVYEPYSRYALQQAGRDLMEEGEFIAEPGGTRLRFSIGCTMYVSWCRSSAACGCGATSGH